jgi:hypothetical protein
MLVRSAIPRVFMPARHEPLRLVAMFAMGAAALLLAAGAIWLLWLGSEQRALRDLPAAERAVLYRRTLEDLQSVCAAASAGGLADHCQEQARFILGFPECDPACRRLARRHLPLPTR